MIVLIVGPDAAAAHAAASSLATDHDPEGTNTSRFDGRETSLSAVTAAIGSVGFFGGCRVVVVQNLMARTGRGAADGRGGEEAEEPARRSASLDLAPLFAAVPEQNALILLDPDLAGVPAAVKRAAPASAQIIGHEPPRGRALLDWLRRVAHDAGGEMTVEAAKLLAESFYPQTWSSKPSNPRYDRPPDTLLLRNEVDKLVLAAHPEPVRPKHVTELSPAGVDDRLFRFLEAAAAGGSRLPTALVELERLLQAGEEPAKLGAQLAQQAELAILLEVAPGKDPISIGRDIGLANPARMSGLARGRGGAAVPAAMALRATLAADRGLKRGRLRHPTDALYEQTLGQAISRGQPKDGT